MVARLLVARNRVHAAQAGNPNAKCAYNSYVVLGDRSRFIDQQTLKLQASCGAAGWGQGREGG